MNRKSDSQQSNTQSSTPSGQFPATTTATLSATVVFKGFAFVLGCFLTLKGAIATFLTLQTQFFGLVALESGYVNPATHVQTQNLPAYFGWQYGIGLTWLLLGCVALMVALGRKNPFSYVLISSLIWLPCLIWAIFIVLDLLTPSLAATSRFSSVHPTIMGTSLSETKAIALLLLNGLMIMALLLLSGLNLSLLGKIWTARSATAAPSLGQRLKRHYKSLSFVAIATVVILFITNPSQQRHFTALAMRAQGVRAQNIEQMAQASRDRIAARIDDYGQSHRYRNFLLFSTTQVSTTQDQTQATSFGILGSVYLHNPQVP